MVFIDPPYDLCFADNLNFTLCGTSDLLRRFRSGESKTQRTLQAEAVQPGCSRSNNIGQKAVWPFGPSGLFAWTLMGAFGGSEELERNGVSPPTLLGIGDLVRIDAWTSPFWNSQC